MKDFTFIDSASPSEIENLYEQYKNDPENLEPSWRAFFSGFDYAAIPDSPVPSPYVDFVAGSNSSAPAASASDVGVRDLIYAYRSMGHLAAKINPCLLYTSDAADD